MNKTKIEWVKNPDGSQGYSWNPITGCLNHVNGMCKGGGFPCYAYRLANTRLRERYLANKNITRSPYKTRRFGHNYLEAESDSFYPRFWPEKLTQPYRRKKPAGIFTCDMSDLFGIGIPEDWTQKVIHWIRECPQHRFYLLTKQPQNLAKFDFPDNCWVGVTVTRQTQFTTCGTAMWGLGQSKAKVKFLSFEPLLERISADGSLTLMGERLVDWVIIGAQTKPTVMPKIEWVQEIVEACDKAGVKVFLKDSLYPLFTHPIYRLGWQVPKWTAANKGINKLRQEMPALH